MLCKELFKTIAFLAHLHAPISKTKLQIPSYVYTLLNKCSRQRTLHENNRKLGTERGTAEYFVERKVELPRTRLLQLQWRD